MGVYLVTWMSYKNLQIKNNYLIIYSSKTLNNELISYLGFLKNLKDQQGLYKETKYLDPSFKQKKYDFS